MKTLHNAFQTRSPVPSYLQKVLSIHREVLGANLVALYLHGSVVQADFHPRASDLDILGLVAGPINAELREELAATLSHDVLPVPAFGLELILCTADAVRRPVPEMPFEFALSTGQEWGTEVTSRGTASDILINIQLCRQAAVVLEGDPALDICGSAPRGVLRGALIGELDWHLRDLLTAKAGQATVNAILNAARSVYAAQTGKILSKTQGGRWWLANQQEDSAVALALAYREGLARIAPTTQEARAFVEKVRAMIEAAQE